MGMFDEVLVPCPKCGTDTIVFQSKSGPCLLRTFYIDRVPVDVLPGILGDTEMCSNCGTLVGIGTDDLSVDARYLIKCGL